MRHSIHRTHPSFGAIPLLCLYNPVPGEYWPLNHTLTSRSSLGADARRCVSTADKINTIVAMTTRPQQRSHTLFFFDRVSSRKKRKMLLKILRGSQRINLVGQRKSRQKRTKKRKFTFWLFFVNFTFWLILSWHFFRSLLVNFAISIFQTSSSSRIFRSLIDKMSTLQNVE